jgi:hypothetical protein
MATNKSTNSSPTSRAAPRRLHRSDPTRHKVLEQRVDRIVQNSVSAAFNLALAESRALQHPSRTIGAFSRMFHRAVERELRARERATSR